MIAIKAIYHRTLLLAMFLQRLLLQSVYSLRVWEKNAACARLVPRNSDPIPNARRKH